MLKVIYNAMRAFVSIELLGSIRKNIMRVQAQLPERLSKVRQENLHITLQFLGEIRDIDVASIREAMDAAGARPYKAVIRGISSFGKPDPRVIFAGVQDGGESRRICSALSRELRAAGISFDEEHYYTPHVTIARSKEKNLRLLKFIADHSEDEFGEMEVKSISLMKSTLSSAGSVYETLYECKI